MEVRSGPSRLPRKNGKIGETPERVCVAFRTDWSGVFPSSRGGNVSIQQEGRWRPEEYKTEDARRVSRKLSDKERRSRDSRGGCTM